MSKASSSIKLNVGSKHNNLPIKPNEHIGMWSPILNAAVVPCFAI